MVGLIDGIGTEKGQVGEMTFYGSSFIAGPMGEIVSEKTTFEMPSIMKKTIRSSVIVSIP
jgi:predicted amidohydrolase